MKKYLIDSIDNDVKSWSQNADELTAWTIESMKRELETIDLHEFESNADDACTLDELATLYVEAAHQLARELKGEQEQ